MKILITGAKGMVGRAAAFHFMEAGDRVLAMSRDELDITDGRKVDRIVSSERPHAVVNCAAYTDVDGAESDASGCFAVNTEAVGVLAAAADRAGSRFVTISSDYVFDGEKEGFYTQSDEARPLGVYGRSKLKGERLAAEKCPTAVIIRTGWIYGAKGTNFLSVIPSLLEAGTRINAIRDSWGTPTYVDDLVSRIRELLTVDVCGIFHVTNSGPGASYAEFAMSVAQNGGYDQRLVNVVSAAELERAAPRPGNSRLACGVSASMGFRDLPDWESGIRRFLSSRSGGLPKVVKQIL